MCLHTGYITACASDEIDFVNDTSSILVGAVNRRFGWNGCFLLLPGSYRMGVRVSGEITSSTILVNHDWVAQSGTIIRDFLHSSCFF